MTDALFALVPQYGSWIVFAVTFLSCLALPIPASLVMLAAGAFVASGDLSGPMVLAGALMGAILGDQLGFLVGRIGGRRLLARLSRRPKMAVWLGRAEARLVTRAGRTVFLSRWLVSALGPYVNLAAGTAHVGWRRFSLAATLGEIVWVGLYVGLGIVFASHLDAVGATVPSVLLALAAAAGAVMAGRALLRRRPA